MVTARQLNTPERLAKLRGHPDKDLPTVPELVRWSRGIPKDQRDEATALWTRWQAQLATKSATGDGNADSEARAFAMLTLQLAGELDLTQRYELYEQAAEAMRPRHRPPHTLLAAHAASTAVRLGDLEGAQRWLVACEPCDEPLADSPARIALATFAIARNDPAEAIALLGRGAGTPAGSAEEVPLLLSYHRMAGVLRSHALDRTGDRPAARAELTALVQSCGAQNSRTHRRPAARGLDR